MIPLGELSDASYTDMLALLRTHHMVRVRLDLLTLNHGYLSTLTNRLLQGQVSVDADAEVTRACALTLSDPKHTLAFDSSSPDDGAVFVDRMVQCVYCIKGEGTPWYEVPVFTGPIVKMDRQADAVSIEAQGKEALAMGFAWKADTFPRNSVKTTMIKSILGRWAGERRFSIPELGERTTEPFPIGREDVPWARAGQVAGSLGRQLFYDGAGTCRLRTAPTAAGVTFKTGDDGATVQTPPQVAYNIDDVRNVVWVKGAGTVEHIEYAQRDHPLSPWKLGRVNSDGDLVPRYLVEKVEASDIRSKAKAVDVAKKRLDELLRQAVEVTFDSWPTNPCIEEADRARLTLDDTSMTFTLRQFTIPLLASENQSVGYLKRLHVARDIRSRRR